MEESALMPEDRQGCRVSLHMGRQLGGCMAQDRLEGLSKSYQLKRPLPFLSASILPSETGVKAEGPITVGIFPLKRKKPLNAKRAVGRQNNEWVS